MPKLKMDKNLIKSKARAARKTKSKPKTAAKRVKQQKISFDQYESNIAEGFWFANGVYTQSLSGLLVCLRDIPQWVFEHHVSQEKNDFSNWVRDVFGLNQLGDEMRSCHSTKETVQCLERWQKIV